MSKQPMDYYQILKLIKHRGAEGILQSDLWKEIGATSREGSRIASRFIKAGLIRREPELHVGKWTYRLISKKYPLNFDSVRDYPCTFCMTQGRCGEEKYVTPGSCEELSSYVLRMVQRRLGSQNMP